MVKPVSTIEEAFEFLVEHEAEVRFRKTGYGNVLVTIEIRKSVYQKYQSQGPIDLSELSHLPEHLTRLVRKMQTTTIFPS